MALLEYLITTSTGRAELISRSLYLLGVSPDRRASDDPTRLMFEVVTHPSDGRGAIALDLEADVLVSRNCDLQATLSLLTIAVTPEEMAFYQGVVESAGATPISIPLQSLLPASAISSLKDRGPMETDGWFPSLPNVDA